MEKQGPQSIIKFSKVKWDTTYGYHEGKPTKNIYIVDEIGYEPISLLGGLFFCDVDSANYRYIKKLPKDVEEYDVFNDGENGAIAYVKQSYIEKQ